MAIVLMRLINQGIMCILQFSCKIPSINSTKYILISNIKRLKNAITIINFYAINEPMTR